MSPSARAIRLPALEIRGKRFEWGTQTFVMGIVNASPDSFSGDGHSDPQEAIAHALAQAQAGADILDIGAESTRPGHVPISSDEELRRLIPVVQGVRARLSDAVISIDTFKPEVFAAAHEAGADVLNSVWGLDDALLECALACRVPVVIMHNKRVATYERDVVEEVAAYLAAQGARAVAAGIAPERVIVDPGIGFGKTPEHNLALLRALGRFVALGYPALLGASRKSTLGKLTMKTVKERSYATAATVALAAFAGIDVVRVHDVGPMRDVVAVTDAIVREWRPANWEEVR